jgi:predicted GNAT family N-acyltransferase
MFDIRKITAAETYPIRHQILRQNEPLEKCIYPNDEAETTFHLGLFEEENLVGIISVFETRKELFEDLKQFQIRGMAVLENHRKKNYGAALVKQAIAILENEQDFLIWFNAREIAVGFYEKLGFERTGAIFEIVPIGLHYIMFKRFTKSKL